MHFHIKLLDKDLICKHWFPVFPVPDTRVMDMIQEQREMIQWLKDRSAPC